ncbi:flagellin [Methanoculleus sp. Wushi-C6]|uniref:Flagellin n=1 Tax=Methanoculleus caldifontis TaxID=2651577 RepID=A0ABU3X2S0_9EURY|nr:archaellin/type IV pilin N-terminal domain-containing protein [Methanoculleus sp. Wushi-C6]MDV2482347.1 flagellin [Methanoculleus sp. Wushi-C6]
MSKFVRNEDAFTGLEAAIVLIAFVVVAAVFSYVVLGAGFFTTQKSQEVVHTSVSQTSSSMEVVGDVIGVGAANKLTSATITLGLSAGGGTVDFEKLVVTFSNKTTVQTLTQADPFYDEDADAAEGEWSISKRMNTDGDTGNLLEAREQFTISAGFPGAIDPNGEFTIEVKPVVGSSLAIVRTAPEQIDAINRLF